MPTNNINNLIIMKNETRKINPEKDRPIINILGEICWGFNIDDFEKKIGVKKQAAELLLERLLKDEKSENIEILLNDSEVGIIRNALNEVKGEIEEWEFNTRIGLPLDKVEEISIFK